MSYLYLSCWVHQATKLLPVSTKQGPPGSVPRVAPKGKWPCEKSRESHNRALLTWHRHAHPWRWFPRWRRRPAARAMDPLEDGLERYGGGLANPPRRAAQLLSPRRRRRRWHRPLFAGRPRLFLPLRLRSLLRLQGRRRLSPARRLRGRLRLRFSVPGFSAPSAANAQTRSQSEHQHQQRPRTSDRGNQHAQGVIASSPDVSSRFQGGCWHRRRWG